MGDAEHQERVNLLFVKHSPQIRGFILSLLPGWSRADDVLQETFLTVSAKADRYVEGTNFVAWACRIARFKVLEECRRGKQGDRSFSAEVIETLCCSWPERSDDIREAELSALKSCLDSLAPHTRRAIDLRYARAHRIPEIARTLDWSVDSVYVVLSRARAKLLECVRSKVRFDIDG